MRVKEQLKIVFGADRIGLIQHFCKYFGGYRRHRTEFQHLKEGRRCYLIGTANYPNLGDLAISEAQIKFLDCYFEGSVVEIQTSHFWEYARIIKKMIRPEDIICFQGGGNMGDLYSRFEFERCAVMSLFPRNKSIVMPQTISYSSSGDALRAYTQKVYGRQKDLFLFARESLSATTMQNTYKKAEVTLVPDIVFFLDAGDFVDQSSERDGITKFLRNDDERSLSNRDWKVIDAAVSKYTSHSKSSDTVFESGQEISANVRKKYLHDILNSFMSSSAVVTDRLHGMLFAYITHTPCVVLANSNHKIAGVYQWIQDCGFIKFVKEPNQVDEALRTVLDAQTNYSRNEIIEKFTPLIELF